MVSFTKKGQQSEENFKIGLKGEDQRFVIEKKGEEFLMINGSNGDMKIHKNLQIVDEFKIGLQGSFKINGVSQWKMIHEEFGTNFDLDKWKLTNSGAMLKITECGGFHLLGGYGQLSMHKLSTTISLDGYEFDHIKIDARFHFIDAWSGHTAYVKVP